MKENQEPINNESQNNSAVTGSTPLNSEASVSAPVAKPLNTVDLTKSNIDIDEPADPASLINNSINRVDISESNPVGGAVPPANNENGISQVYIPEPEKKKLSNKAIASIVIAIVVIGAIIFGVVYFLNRPKVTFLNTVNKSYNELMENYEDLKDNDLYEKAKDKAIESTGTFGINLTTTDPNYRTLANLMNNMKLNYSYGIDYKNKNALYNFDLKSSGVSLFNTATYLKNNKLFVQLKNLYSKFIEVDMGSSYNEFFTNQMTKDLDYVLRTTKDELLDELKDSDFDKTKEELSLNGKTIKTKKLTLNLDANRIKEIRDVVIDSLLANEKFIGAYANVTGATESEVTKNLKELKNESLNSSTLNIDVYVDGDEAIQYVVNIKDEFTDDIISFSDYDDYTDLTLKQSGNITFAITKQNDKTLINAGSATIEISKQDDNNYDFVIKSGISQMTGTVAISEKEISTTQTDKKMTITLNMDAVTKMVVTATSSQKIVDKITIPEVTGAVKVEDLSSTDLNTILTNFLNNKELVRIMTIISGGNTITG